MVSFSHGKISCRRTKDMSSNPVYIKNQLVSIPDDINNHHKIKYLNTIITKKK